MTDDFYSQRKPIEPSELDNPMANVEKVQQALDREGTGSSESNFPQGGDSPLQITGNVPPELLQQTQPQQPKKTAPPNLQLSGSDSERLKEVLQILDQQQTANWEPFEWPSRGKFYNDIPPTVTIRPMTGEEEQILATPRFVKRGKAIDMIFAKCIREQIDTSKLLSADRTHLLIFLRGISYTPEYDVEIKCPECGLKFSDVLDLNNLDVTYCSEEFKEESLEGTLPSSGLPYRYRLSTGEDEMLVSSYREQKIAKWGEQSEDDTLLYRTALLLEELGGLESTRDIQMVMKKLSMEDVSYLRNEVSDPPFGVDTEVPILCPSCSEEFKIDLPLETSFFFPRKKETSRA